MMIGSPKLADSRLARVTQNRSPSVASPCPDAKQALRCVTSASQCRAEPLYPFKLILFPCHHSLVPITVLSHPQVRAAVALGAGTHVWG